MAKRRRRRNRPKIPRKCLDNACGQTVESEEHGTHSTPVSHLYCREHAHTRTAATAERIGAAVAQRRSK